MNLKDYCKKNNGLSTEHIIQIENILMNGCRKSQRREMATILKNYNFSLVKDGELSDKQFSIVDDRVLFTPIVSHMRNAELKTIRQEIFKRYGNGSDRN